MDKLKKFFLVVGLLLVFASALAWKISLEDSGIYFDAGMYCFLGAFASFGIYSMVFLIQKLIGWIARPAENISEVFFEVPSTPPDLRSRR